MATILVYDTSGAIRMSYTFSADLDADRVAADNTPTGMSHIPVEDGHPAVYNSMEWSVLDGKPVKNKTIPNDALPACMRKVAGS